MARAKFSFQSLTLLIAISLSTIAAFTPQTVLSPFGVLNRHGDARINVALEASRSSDKITSRTKWSEARGYGIISAANDSLTEGAKKVPRLIIAGAPASGKGTQCEIIKEKYGVVHLSTGDMLRAAVAAQTEVGKVAKDYMDAGKIVPDDVIIGVVRMGNFQSIPRRLIGFIDFD